MFKSGCYLFERRGQEVVLYTVLPSGSIMELTVPLDKLLEGLQIQRFEDDPTILVDRRLPSGSTEWSERRSTAYGHALTFTQRGSETSAWLRVQGYGDDGTHEISHPDIVTDVLNEAEAAWVRRCWFLSQPWRFSKGPAPVVAEDEAIAKAKKEMGING